MPGQFLTKSRFKIGTECPSKLLYLDDNSYGNLNKDNTFLASLAEGGFQVGELAKQYFPNGIEITTIDKHLAAKETLKLLENDKVIIYEASFLFENLFVKSDIVIKNGNSIEVIEVKAKSYDPSIEDQFYSKRSLKSGKPKLNHEWKPYLTDIAFQTFVIRKVLRNTNVTSSMMFADKSATASVEGLNQKFFIGKDEKGRSKVSVCEDIDDKVLGDKVLVKVKVDSEVDLVLAGEFENGMDFQTMVNYLSDICKNRKANNPVVGSHCKSCEFRIDKKTKEKGLLSGFEKCWSSALSIKAKDFDRPFIFDIWNFRKSDALIEQGKYFIDQLEADDISPTSNDESGLSISERQWMQIHKIITGDESPFLDIRGLQQEIKSWIYPLHFIDFETTMVAIPFNKGRRPYEQIAFQFSHHTISKDGKITHQSEYINRKKGVFPNFEFVRELKKALDKDHGTIFRYAAHENSVLCQIREQLIETNENVPDREILIEFIESITAGSSTEKEWSGQRNMVDMCELVKKFFFHPATKGSNSIKKVLPAILGESTFLQNKYSSPIYGTNEMKSKNFTSWKWIHIDPEGKVSDPYKLLPPIFTDIELEEMEALVSEGSIADGGAAMTSYSRMQFTQMSEDESIKVENALLKYCELDTFAMVLIFEYWNHAVNSSNNR